ncbi:MULTISPECIES: hypothetical protein [Rhizobium]|uniref:hypothetical protein n=1 Tax=Rhizobium TaxID=379 RepID=UPI0028A9919D
MRVLKIFQHALYKKLLPRPAVRRNAGETRRSAVKNVIVFGRHPNPTADYYFTARFADRPDVGYQLADIRRESFTDINAEGALVILCRYVSSSAMRWIRRNEDQLAGVVLFLDDDIPAVILGRDAPLPYRFFLYYRGLYHLKQLNRYLDAVWVSTQRLGESLGGVKFVIVPPAPPPQLWNVKKTSGVPAGEVLIAYHATSVHYSEHRFLQPIIAKVLQERPHARFEVFADRRAGKIWSRMDRVTVRSPVSWAEYLAESTNRPVDIMLVPLCPSHVNACRSPTKRIDVARFGAAAVFSLSEAYGKNEDGDEILLPHDPRLWTEAVIDLIDNADLRKNVADATRARVASMAEEACDLSGLKIGITKTIPQLNRNGV